MKCTVIQGPERQASNVSLNKSHDRSICFGSPISVMKNTDTTMIRDVSRLEASTFIGSSTAKYLNETVSTTFSSSFMKKEPTKARFRGGAEESSIPEPSIFSLRGVEDS